MTQARRCTPPGFFCVDHEELIGIFENTVFTGF